MGLNILFEDEYLIAVKKPYGVLSQGNENVKSLCDDVKAYLQKKGGSGDVFVLHRLDKTTGGAIVYAKTKDCASKMSALIQNGDFHKVYYAVLCGEFDKRSGALADLLYHDKSKNKSYIVKRERKGVKVAKLCFVNHGVSQYKGETVTKIEVLLITGRTHQIRVQFASRKFPLVGDKKYGATISDDIIALYSHEINFKHPYTGEFVKITSDTDKGAFSVFENSNQS